MKKFFIALMISLFSVSSVSAEIKTYEGVGEYAMGERDTLEIAKQGAKDRAIRNALEKAGVLIQSRSRSEDFELIEDEITSQTGAILKVVEVVYDREDFLIRATVKVDIDADDLNRRLENYAKTTPAEKIFLANKKVDEATKLWYEDKNDEAIALLTEATALNPDDPEIFAKRAFIYVGLGEYKNAAYDADKVLKLDPNNTMALWIRGAANLSAGNTAKAIDDLNAAIRLDPNSKYAYYFRGIYYKHLDDKKHAREDFLKAKELGFYGSVAREFLEADN